jgi:hypothetical protein
MPTLVGVFSQAAPVANLARRLRDRGFAELEVYSPVPAHELDGALDEKPSRVRLWTLIGGLTGMVTGFVMTIWMSYDFPIVVGGKALASIPPYVVISFELTILFGGVLTVLGFFWVGGLPFGKFGRHDPTYSPRFSAEDFGLVVRCSDRDVSEIDGLFRAHDAKEVTLVEA